MMLLISVTFVRNVYNDDERLIMIICMCVDYRVRFCVTNSVFVFAFCQLLVSVIIHNTLYY